MTLNFKLDSDKLESEKLLFLPLGGANEIGMNVNLYHYKGKWIMIDCGAGFADEDLPGVDMMVADISFLKQIKADIIGLILTHAHEDHLGGVQFLWQDLGCPIYATTFTANFLRTRLTEYNLTKKVVLHEVKPGAKIDLDPFSIEMVPLTHSAPEMQAIMIRTEAGNILHTGDWKFDQEPLIGNVSDEDLLKKYGQEGVLALVCDSTNVFNPGTSGSEGELRKSLVDIIVGCPKMAIVTTFASNLARLDTLIHAAEKAGRKVALTGRSLHRMLDAAQSSGYLQDIGHIIDEKDVGRFNREEVMVIATGCQGEQMAAISKIANGKHPFIRLAPKDTVLFSSKIIPGNEKKIYKIFNSLIKHKVEVITERDHFVHVSGHPSIDELKRMYELVKPIVAIPVHGEPIHIHEHARLARTFGAKHALEVENGTLVEIDPHTPKILDQVKSGYLGIDGNYLLDSHSHIFRMRRRLKEAGIVVATLITDGRDKLVTKPILTTTGCLDRQTDGQLIDMLRNAISDEIKVYHSHRKAKFDSLEHLVKTTIKRFIKTELGKSPIVEVNIENVRL